MTYQPYQFNRLIKDISKLIEDDLVNAGIFYRIFSRVKSNESLAKKLSKQKEDGTAFYNGKDKFLRDFIGIRINLYFVDDLQILLDFFKSKYDNDFQEETVDIKNETEFKPSRVNLIFKIPKDFRQEFRSQMNDLNIDCTYELQLRTVFSEGWHEVEHDFRYKCPKDWEEHPILSRTFNGMLAGLETYEWGMIKVFEELSYSHYKSNNFSTMIRMHLRIRTIDMEMSESLLNLLINQKDFIKEFFKLERTKMIEFLLNNEVYFPFTLDNLVYFANFFFIKNQILLKNTPINLKANFRGFYQSIFPNQPVSNP